MIGVMVDRNKAEEIYDWLEKHDMKQHRDWTRHTVPGASRMRISFISEEHAAWFKLRWS